MMPENPLITMQGFEYILSILDKGYSKQTLEQIISAVSQLPESVKKGAVAMAPYKRSKKARTAIKQGQVSGLVQLVRCLEPFENVFEVGCGKGMLIEELASLYPQSKIRGIDSNSQLIEKLNQQKKASNLSFETRDAFDYMPEGIDLVVSLHGCGNLTDRTIDIAINNRAGVICVPCCYGKIKRTENQEDDYYLPRSITLRLQKDAFRKKVLRRTVRLEGAVSERDKTIQGAMRDIYRLLVNFDRLFYLKENGYATYVSTITDKQTEQKDGRKQWSSSLRYALIGLSTQEF